MSGTDESGSQANNLGSSLHCTGKWIGKYNSPYTVSRAARLQWKRPLFKGHHISMDRQQ